MLYVFSSSIEGSVLNGMMMQFYDLFNNIRVISGRLAGNNKKLCAKAPFTIEKISAPGGGGGGGGGAGAGLEPGEAKTRNK